MQSGGDQTLQENNLYFFKKIFDNQIILEYTLTIKVKEACFGRFKNQ